MYLREKVNAGRQCGVQGRQEVLCRVLVFLRILRGQPMLQLHIRPWGKAALPSREGLHRKKKENEKQETEFNIIALSLYSIY